MTFLRAGFCNRQDFRAVLRHENGVLELRGQTAIDRANRPAIGPIEARAISANVQHWFNREAHPRLDDLSAKFCIGKVRHTRFLVECAANSVSLVFADDFVALGTSEVVNRPTDIHNASPRFDGMDALPKRVESRLHKGFGFRGDFANEERFRLIPVPTIDNCGDIHVDDVAILERDIVGNSVANNVIDAGADRLWVSAITQARRRMPVTERVLVRQAIKIVGRHTGLDVLPKMVH